MGQITYGFNELGELVDHMVHYLHSAPREARIAAAWVLSVHRSEDLLEAIRKTLEDNHFSGHRIASLASGMLSLKITYQGDSVAYIADPCDPSDSPERAVARLLEAASPEGDRKTPSH